ncbi:MAG: choice-of-anchor J domain-containing protein [Bacteroidales bacterium]|nr:choice-of-anchor J domain-containing protein [Bacteroidales bacterium]
MKRNLLSIGMLALMLIFSARSFAQNTYTMVTSASGLEAGAKYILVGFDDDGNAYAMSYQKSNNRHAVSVSEAGGTITTTIATNPDSQTEVFEFELGGSTGEWTIYDPLREGYLNAPGGGNYLKTQSTLTDNGKWDITIGANGAGVPVSLGAVDQRYMRFNLNAANNSPLFGCYKESSNIIAEVYFFKAGQAQINPEPSNYPTNFSADAGMLDVVLTWNDATGAQLPDRYLVVASTGNITVPADGTPVPNSEMAINVNPGVQTATFSNLDGNTTYHFAIFPYTNAGANIDYKTDGTYPTATATTADVYVLLNEGFESDLGVFTAYDVYGDQTWLQKTYNGNGYANMNGYANNVYNENEDWLISPAMNGEYASIMMSFSTAMKFDGEPLQVMISTDYDGQSEPSDFTWENITDMFDYSTGNYEWVESGAIDIESFAGATFYIAFVYTCTSEMASAWEVDNVLIIASEPLTVAENESAMLSVYPNPAKDMISFTLNQDAQVAVYDMSGRMVSEKSCMEGLVNYEVSSLENGVYFVNFNYADGQKAVAKFVKF